MGNVFDEIKSRMTALEYARDYLGLPVYKDEDRCTASYRGGETTTSLHFSGHTYTDWGSDNENEKHGSVIDLCALYNHKGDIYAAVDELCKLLNIERDNGWTSEAMREEMESFSRLVDKAHADLRPEDKEYLAARYIREDTIKRLGIGYVTEENIKAAGGLCYEHKDRLLIPYWKNGNPVFSISRDRGMSSPEKYKKMQRDKSPNDHIIWGLQSLNLYDTKNVNYGKAKEDIEPRKLENLLILEGAFDAMSAEQEGYKVISPITGNFSNYNMKEALDICKSSLARDVKRIVVCFDNDRAGKGFARKMMNVLFSWRLPFVSVTVPSDINGNPIKDVSDFYCFKKREHEARIELGTIPPDTPCDPIAELLKLAVAGPLALARLRIPVESEIDPAKDEVGTIEDYSDFMYEFGRWAEPYELERIYQDTLIRHAGYEGWDAGELKNILKTALKCPPDINIVNEIKKKYSNLCYSGDTGFIDYEGDKSGKWASFTKTDITQRINKALGRWTSGNKINSVLTVLKAKVNQSNHIQLDRQHVFNFRNGTLNLDAGSLKIDPIHGLTPSGNAYEFDPSTVKLEKHNASFYCGQVAAYDFNPAATCDKWLDFIRTITNNDAKSMALLQEYAGYILFTDCSAQKILVLCGDGANGKSVYIDVLSAVFADKEDKGVISNFNLEDLKDATCNIEFARSFANFSDETKSDLRGYEHIIKKVAVGAPQQGRGAYKEDTTKIKAPRTKLIISANDRPRFNESGHAINRRFVYCNFPIRFVDREPTNENERRADSNLTRDIIQNELSGVFNWAYAGYLALLKKGVKNMTITDDQTEIKRDFITSNNNIAAFVLDWDNNGIIRDKGYSFKELYELFKTWANTFNRGQSTTQNFFTMNLKKVLPELEIEYELSEGAHRQGKIVFSEGQEEPANGSKGYDGTIIKEFAKIPMQSTTVQIETLTQKRPQFVQPPIQTTVQPTLPVKTHTDTGVYMYLQKFKTVK